MAKLFILTATLIVAHCEDDQAKKLCEQARNGFHSHDVLSYSHKSVDALLLFTTSPSTPFCEIPWSSVGAKYIDFSSVSCSQFTTDSKVSEMFDYTAQTRDKPTGYYQLELWTGITLHCLLCLFPIWKYKAIATTTTTTLFLSDKAKAEEVQFLSGEGPATIVHGQNNEVGVYGGVIRKDNMTGGVSIIPLKFKDNSGWFWPDAAVELQSSKIFWLIEAHNKTTLTLVNVFRLLERKKDNEGPPKRKEKHQLFKEPPVGFIQDDTLYLFDELNLCVYIVQGWKNIDLFDLVGLKDENFKDLIFSRTNVPYEEFFRCGSSKNASANNHLNPERCDRTSYKDDKQAIGTVDSAHGVHMSQRVAKKDGVVPFLINGLVMLVVLGGVYWWCTKDSKSSRSSRLTTSSCSSLTSSSSSISTRTGRRRFKTGKRRSGLGSGSRNKSGKTFSKSRSNCDDYDSLDDSNDYMKFRV